MARLAVVRTRARNDYGSRAVAAVVFRGRRRSDACSPVTGRSKTAPGTRPKNNIRPTDGRTRSVGGVDEGTGRCWENRGHERNGDLRAAGGGRSRFQSAPSNDRAPVQVVGTRKGLFRRATPPARENSSTPRTDSLVMRAAAAAADSPPTPRESNAQYVAIEAPLEMAALTHRSSTLNDDEDGSEKDDGRVRNNSPHLSKPTHSADTKKEPLRR